MAKIKFLSRFLKPFQKMIAQLPDLRESPFGFVLLAFDKKNYETAIKEFFKKLDAWEVKNNDTRELEVELKVSYRDRTLDQNALMWALYEIEADDQNGGMVGAQHQMVDKLDLYEADLENWGEKDLVQTTVSRIFFYTENYRIVRIMVDGGFVKITRDNRAAFLSQDPTMEVCLQITRGTSQYNTVEMARHIDGIFNRLAETVGITDVGDLAMYKDQFEAFKKSKKINVHFNDFRVLEMEE